MIKVAFVGCGGMQRVHCSILSKMDGVVIVGHCDTDHARAQSFADEFGGVAFDDHESLYGKARPDAVYIAVPPFAHVGMEESAAQRGIHLFIEKPIAIKRETAKRIAAVTRAAKIVTSVGYCWRYYDTVPIARQFLKGKCVSLVNGWWQGGMPEVWWWREQDKSGGQFMEQTTHVLDMLRYLCGEVAEVYAMASAGCMSKVKGYSVHDSGVVSLTFKSGAAGSIISTCISPNGGKEGLDIVTPEATLQLRGDGRLTISDGEKTVQYSARVNTYEEESRAFIDAVRTGKRGRIRSTYSDAVKSFMVAVAATESLESGLPVKP